MAKNTQTKPYTDSIFFNDSNDIYIHLHQYNIGKANGQNITSTTTITKIFKNQKDKAWEVTKKAYFNMARHNINIKRGTPEYDLLNTVFSGIGGEDEEKLFNQIDKEMGDALQQSLDNENKTAQLVQYQRNYFKNNSNILNGIFIDKDHSLEAFDNLLQVMADCCKLIEGETSAGLAAALLSLKGNNFSSTIDFGNALEIVLQNFARENNGKTLTEKRMQMATETFNSIVKRIRTEGGKTNPKDLGSLDSFRHSMDHMFSSLAEAVQSIIGDLADTAVNNTILKFDKSGFSLTGKETYVFKVYDENGVPETLDTTPRAGKADMKFKNTQFRIKALEDVLNGNATISIDLGISNKTYRSNHFRGLDDNKTNKNKFGLNAGGKLIDALNLLFNYNSFNIYLAYNILAHQEKRMAEVRALQDGLLTRQLLSIASSRGGIADFSQYIIANGTVVSIWQLVLMAQGDVGLSSSAVDENGQNNQALTLSIPGRQALNSAVKKRKAENRVYAVNTIMRDLDITAYLHVDKYLQVIGKHLT